MNDYLHDNGKKLIWGIGGATDLQFGIEPKQVDNFAGQVKSMLSKVGDGIDFDFEHLSVKDDGSLMKTFADMIYTTRKALDDAGMQDKTISYTARYNAAWTSDNLPDGWSSWQTDGEALKINHHLKSKYNTTFDACVDHA